MRIKLIEEVHEEIDLEGADTEDDVLLRLGTVTAVIASRLLPLHPQVDELLELQAKAESCCPHRQGCPGTGSASLSILGQG